MKNDCRSCGINFSLTGNRGKHKLVDVGIFCPVCMTASKSIHHSENDDLVGDAYECSGCHNYILYTDGKGDICKDEIYLTDEYFLIRDLEDNTSFFGKDGDKVFSSESIIQFTDVKELFHRLKNLRAFI